MSLYECPSCHKSSNSQYFYQCHVGEDSILIIDTTGRILSLTRDTSEFGSHSFSCPWKGCYYRDCDSDSIKDHINVTCSHRGTLKKGY